MHSESLLENSQKEVIEFSCKPLGCVNNIFHGVTYYHALHHHVFAVAKISLGVHEKESRREYFHLSLFFSRPFYFLCYYFISLFLFFF